MNPPQAVSKSPSVPSRRIRTIVADDSPEFLRSFCAFLEAQPNIELVGRAKNGGEAIHLAETLIPDLAILDLEMPVMDGTRAAAALREKFPALRLVIVSVHDGPAWREMSRAAGVDGFIPKHQLTAELPAHIQTLFTGTKLPPAPPFISSGAAPHNHISVLLVEPDAAHAEPVIHELTRPHVADRPRAHFEVEHATTLAAALERLPYNSVDAVLVGVRLNDPAMLHSISLLRQAAPHAALIAIPDGADESFPIAADALGADECLCLQHSELLPLQLHFLVGGRRAEQSLAKREEDFRMLIENALDITCILDGNFQIRYVSPSARQVLGLSPEELRGRSCLALLHPEDVARAEQTFAEAHAHPQKTVTLEARFQHHSGQWVHLELTGRNLPDNGGHPRLVFNARDHTSRIQAEEALRQSENRFRALFENSPDAIFVEDVAGCVLDVNPAACWLHNLPREKLVGKFVWELVPATLRDQTRIDFHRLVAGEINHLESFSLTGDGRTLPVELTANRILYSGQPAILLHVRDITERKHTEEILIASERSYKGLFNTMRDAIYIMDREGRFIDVNAGAETMYGYPREYFVGKTPEFLSAPGRNDLAAVAGILGRAFAGEPQHFEWWGLRSNGEIFPKEVHIQRGTYFGQTVLITVGRDITERKQVETALRESETRFRQIAENIEEVFWLGDAEQQHMIYVSPAYEKIWGESLQNLLANPTSWLQAVHPEDRTRITEAWETTIRTGHLDQTYRIVRPDGAIRWIRDQAFPVRDETGKIYRLAGVARDITERRELEEQMRQMQKLDSLGRITAGIAHDFNNMLAIIQGHTDQLLVEPNLPPAAAKSLSQVAEASRSAAKLTRQLLTFSRKQDLHLKTIDLNNVVAGLAQMLQHVLGDNTTLNFQPLDRTAWIHADAGMMEQVLMNLVVNAHDAMPDGGELTIALTRLEVDTAFLRRDSESRRGPHLCLNVSDTGAGIPPEILPRIFEPFFTTKAENHGTGLGLATVYGIIKQHGGWIEVASTPGHGTHFKIFLPASHHVAAPTPEISSPTGAATKSPSVPQTATVLVVEDELPLLQLHCLNLKRRGYHVLSAESGPRALEVVAQNPGPIDLLIADMGLPGGMTGRAVAETLQKTHPGLKVIITSGYLIPPESNPPPNLQFLAKPFDFKQLSALVSQAVERN